MAVSLATTKKLLTSSEYALVSKSEAKNITQLSETQLKSKITRAKKLRQKFRDLNKRQKGSHKRSQGGTSVAERTEKKMNLFSDVLGKFQEALEKKKSKIQKPTPKLKKVSKSRKKKPTITTQQSKKNTRLEAISKASRGVRKSKIQSRTAGKRIGAHIRSQTARNQARRDRR